MLALPFVLSTPPCNSTQCSDWIDSVPAEAGMTVCWDGGPYCALHARRIPHRDLKTDNLFLGDEDALKLGDFGIAREMSHETQKVMTVVGTPYYMAPEVINSDEYAEPADAWAVGVICYELLALERPFDGATFASLMMKIARGNVANTAALDASGHPAPLRWLASKDALLHPDADERMTIPALIEHCAIESLARASAREVGSGGRGGGSIMSAVV